MNTWNDADWIAFTGHYLTARRSGLTVDNVRDWRTTTADNWALRALGDWTNQESAQWLGPTTMPVRVRRLLESDGLLPEGSARFVRVGTRRLEYSSDVYALAARAYLDRCRSQGRQPQKNDRIRVPAMIIHPRTFSRLWARNPRNYRIERGGHVSVAVGRRMTEPHRFAIDDHELNAWHRAGWAPRNLHTDQRLAELNARYAWLSSVEIRPADRSDPATFVPGPSRPSTFHVASTPPYLAHPSPGERRITEAEYDRINLPEYRPRQAAVPDVAQLAEAPRRNQVRPDAPLGTRASGAPIQRRPVPGQSNPTTATPDVARMAEARLRNQVRPDAPLGTNTSGTPIQRRPVPNQPNPGRGPR
ncbi:hypothetical protein [Micromonospora yangpuensis]|uniref:Uncharacterized protein n=1 Tax=Micromonospora yangpuensis TaxID=683228 RepID=A0A1C6U5L6_9ACTN|nr:hypothetical protein [Micromonospora yangpuensis]GGL91848.1 hypothetical protein GCM10012279_06980 [Micromonospora yangpuensis]SCL49233.1 hypothetical protein GA0070617_1118 [Micromonospora yangpuensis]